MNSAQKLIQKLTNEVVKNAEKHSKGVIVDHLAFSFQVANLRHFRNIKKTGFASSSQRPETIECVSAVSQYFLDVPQIDSINSPDMDVIEKHKTKSQTILADYYEAQLRIFADVCLGFDLSKSRGLGFHGYKDSMTLYSKNGVECGFVGIGGQNNTVFFQISGLGCKHLFSFVSYFVLHQYLQNVLAVNKLARIDLASDCFDNNFNCEYAEKAYIDDFFRVSNRGQSPSFGVGHKYTFDKQLNKVYTQEMVTIGSRTSAVYWRIYNKKLEQGINKDGFTWYRSEVELKKADVNALLNPQASFAGVCPFAETIESEPGVLTRALSATKEKESEVDEALFVAGRVRWFKRMAGRALGDVLDYYNGDIEKSFGLLMPDDTGGKLGLPNTYKNTLDNALRV